MELRQLYYFVAIADTLSFSRAAESLYVSQSALSKQIASLEEELGVALLSRGGKRSISLTKEGELLLHEAKEILMRSEKLVPMLRHASGSTSTRESVFIALEPRVTDDPIVHRVLTNVVYEQRRAHPGLRALFRKDEYPVIKEALADGSQDLGIFLHTGPELDEALETLTLREDEMVLVFRSPNEYEDTRESVRRVLQNRGVILLEKEPRGMAQILNLLESINCAPQIRFCGHRSAMTLTMESGESAAILPGSMARRLEGDDLHILHFQDPAAKLYLVAAWYKGCGNELVHKIVRRLYEELDHKIDPAE